MKRLALWPGWLLYSRSSTQELSRRSRRLTSFISTSTSIGFPNINFEGFAVRSKAKRFIYKHRLEYIPSSKLAPRADASLPFEIESAAFRVEQAQGEIIYERILKRVTSAQEVFHARGTVARSVLEIPSTVDVDEKQVFAIQVTPQRSLNIPESKQR